MIPRLKNIYDKEILPKLMAKFNFSNKHQVPKITKVVLNIGLGEDATDARKVKSCQNDLSSIAGQKAIITKFRKSIANFKLREGVPIGVMVTLRGNRMYQFFERLVNFALPRERDFKGLPKKSFDGRGNYTMGLKEQLIFPEIEYDKIEKIQGMNITICTTARTDEEGRCLLTQMGLPLRK